MTAVAEAVTEPRRAASLVVDTVRSTWPLWALFAILCSIHLAWWWVVQRPPSWDQAHHITVGLEYARAIQNGSFLTQYMDRPELYPPAYHLLIALPTLMLGSQGYLGLLVNLLLMPVLLTLAALGVVLMRRNRKARR